MVFRVAIPSFKRVDILKEKTLKLLEKYNIDFNIIDLFLENENQFDIYYEALECNLKYHDINIIITDTEGIGAKRNFIRNYYREYTDQENILCIDDDIEKIFIMDKEIQDLKSFINKSFIITREKGLNIWGVSAYHNPFFMKDNITTNLKYICGAFFGLVIDRKKEILQTGFNHYEDFEFTILHFIRDNGVVRFNNIAIKTKYFGEGGINESYGGRENRKKDMKEAGFRFLDKYKKYCRLIQKNYGYDIRLNYRAKVEEVLC